MDSVPGKVGGKVLLTMNFNHCAFMLAFLRDTNNSQSVIDIFNMLEERLTLEVFRTLFPVILTDNGSEFSTPGTLEGSPFSEKYERKPFMAIPILPGKRGKQSSQPLKNDSQRERSGTSTTYRQPYSSKNLAERRFWKSWALNSSMKTWSIYCPIWSINGPFCLRRVVKFSVSVYNVRQQPGHYTMENDRLWVRVNTRNIRI